MIWRLARDESGMTMGLAIMMIVLISVMGAGLLTFTSRDLNSVIEENRGQRAFEVADAGIEAAKRQLASNVVRTDYDSVSPDIQWSKAQGGLTLNDLDGKDLDGAGGLEDPTPDSVNVTISYCAKDITDPQCAMAGSPPAEEYFRVISEGTYGDPPQQAKRRIEAIFNGVVNDSSGGDSGHPVYYTKTNIMIKAPAASESRCQSPVKLDKVSLFARGDILLQTHSSCPIKTTTLPDAKSQFQSDYDAPNGLITASGPDALCDWNSWIPADPTTCFTEDKGGTGKWNTLSRPSIPGSLPPGFAAERLICAVSSASTGACPDGAQSIADGTYRAVDSTTNPRFVVKDCQLPDTASPTCPDNAPIDGIPTISYPFPLPKPIPAGLKDAACTSADIAANNCEPKSDAGVMQIPTVSYFEGIPPCGTCPNSTWGLDNDTASQKKVTFIDAQNQTITWNSSAGGEIKGTIVVWCGRLVMARDFRGVILNLVGETLPGNTSCTRDTPTTDGLSSVGTYENTGFTCQCWVYAEGGTSTLAGIVLDPNSQLRFLPSASFNFRSNLFQQPQPTDFRLQRWRELYQAGP